MHGSLESWRYEFIIVGAMCAFWAIIFSLLLNSPVWGFSHEERLLMIVRTRCYQTGVERWLKAQLSSSGACLGPLLPITCQTIPGHMSASCSCSLQLPAP